MNFVALPRNKKDELKQEPSELMRKAGIWSGDWQEGVEKSNG